MVAALVYPDHTSRVLKALGTPTADYAASAGAAAGSHGLASPHLSAEEIIPNEFPNLHEEEE